jgi:uncharacterized damage-inducible protein DinB
MEDRPVAMSDSMKDHFTRLFQHLAWADARVLESLRSAQNPQKRGLELYSHILGSEHVWLSRINGTTRQVDVWPVLTLEECERLGKENVAAFRDLVSRLTPDLLEKSITYRNSAGDQFTSTVEDMLTHVAMHGSYHRGQIATALRAGGDAPSPTDYIAFVRGAPAATRR